MRIEHPSLKSWTFALRGFQIHRFLKDKWPAFMFAYQTALAYTAAFIVFQAGRALGFA